MLDYSLTPLDRARLLTPEFAQKAAIWDQERRYCWENVKQLTNAGLMGMTLPIEYGGQGANWQDCISVIEEIASACTLSARIVVEANMGALSAIMAYGSDVQKQLAASLVLAGDKPAICITEPNAGSAATEMTTTAVHRGDTYYLTGHKHWITGGGISHLYLIFAQVIDHSGENKGIGAFLVKCDPQKSKYPNGFKILRHERTMGLCGMPEAELAFDNLAIPSDMALLPAGGFRDLMSAYNSQRIGAGAVALGVARGAMEHAISYMHKRQQFGQKLADFQGLQWMIADMDTQIHAARLMLTDAAKTAEGRFPDMHAAARAKLFSSEMAIRVVDNALQIFGARGYGDGTPLSRMYRDVRMFTIGGGTAQILRNQISGCLLRSF